MGKPNVVTRKSDSKVIYYNNVKHKFFPAPSFPPGKLPTKKRCDTVYVESSEFPQKGHRRKSFQGFNESLALL